MAIDSTAIYIKEGKFRGMTLNRVPQSYLTRIINEGYPEAEYAKLELERRGTPYSDNPVEVSNHAIDRLSLRCLDIFATDSQENEGLFAWAVRVAAEAISWDNRDSQGRFVHKGMRFLIDFSPKTPLLVTVLRNTDPIEIDLFSMAKEERSRRKSSRG